MTGALDPLTVIRNGVQTVIPGDEAAELVKAASVQVAMWTPEDLEDHSETDTPWPTWVEADATRAYRSPYMDDSAWPTSVPCEVWGVLIQGWAEMGWADQVLDALTGAEVELTEAEKWVVQAMEDLADRLAGEEDGACRTVAAALARRVHALGVHVKIDDDQTPQDALYEAFAWFLGAEAAGWEYELPTADGLRRGIEQWVEKATSAKGVWKSQAAAIRALVLHSASPQEARQAAQAAFNAR